MMSVRLKHSSQRWSIPRSWNSSEIQGWFRKCSFESQSQSRIYVYLFCRSRCVFVGNWTIILKRDYSVSSRRPSVSLDMRTTYAADNTLLGSNRTCCIPFLCSTNKCFPVCIVCGLPRRQPSLSPNLQCISNGGIFYLFGNEVEGHLSRSGVGYQYDTIYRIYIKRRSALFQDSVVLALNLQISVVVKSFFTDFFINRVFWCYRFPLNGLSDRY